MEINTLYYTFSTIPQVLAAAAAVVGVVMFFRIKQIRKYMVGEGKAVLKRAKDREIGYILDDRPLFSWDDVPGKESEGKKFLNFLKDDLEIEWIDAVNPKEIEKNDDDKAITIKSENNSLKFKIVDKEEKESKVILEINGAKKTNEYEYISRKKKNKIEIYVANKNEPGGYEKRLRDAIFREHILEIEREIKTLLTKEKELGYTLCDRPTGLQYVYHKRFLPTLRDHDIFKVYTVRVFSVLFFSIIVSIISLGCIEIINQPQMCLWGVVLGINIILSIISLVCSAYLVVYYGFLHNVAYEEGLVD